MPYNKEKARKEFEAKHPEEAAHGLQKVTPELLIEIVEKLREGKKLGKTASQVAREMKMRYSQLAHIAYLLRKQGVDIPAFTKQNPFLEAFRAAKDKLMK